MLGVSIAGLGGLATPAPLAAQAVVQPLPPREAADLNDALRRLARAPRDLEALLDAGEASLQVGDVDAAIGFFARAQDVAPENGRVMLGLARCFTQQRRPVEALRLYAEAERVGISEAAMAADRGLAFDLVGDNASAQALYRVALARRDDAEVRRRLALSLAMTGQRQQFEDTLFPLLQGEDRSAFRARAFGLAILGDADDAVDIAEALMPTDLALRMAPYLRYMPRLTRAQQAAAANLGAFPRASEIGRDGAEVAGYSAPTAGRAGAPDIALAPSGPVMGTPAAPAPTAAPSNRPAPSPVQAMARSSSARETRQQRRESERAARRAGSTDAFGRVAPRASRVAARAPSQPLPAPAPAPVPVSASAGPVAGPVATPVAAPVSRSIELPPALPADAPAQVAATDARSSQTTRFDLSQVDPGISDVAVDRAAEANAVEVAALASLSPDPAVAQGIVVEPDPEPTQSVADAFAAFAATQPLAMRPGNAVDITTIEPPRERAVPPPPPAPRPEAKPKPPANPSRHYVQIATGRDRDALKFDWRRIVRKADTLLDGKGPFVTKWVEANRLLAGPYPSADAARETMNKLKAMGIDSFTFTSDAGQAIDRLD